MSQIPPPIVTISMTLRHSLCPAVLTENFFYDSKDDLAFLESDEGKQAVVQLHVDGITNYLALSAQ